MNTIKGTESRISSPRMEDALWTHDVEELARQSVARAISEEPDEPPVASSSHWNQDKGKDREITMPNPAIPGSQDRQEREPSRENPNEGEEREERASQASPFRQR